MQSVDLLFGIAIAVLVIAIFVELNNLSEKRRKMQHRMEELRQLSRERDLSFEEYDEMNASLEKWTSLKPARKKESYEKYIETAHRSTKNLKPAKVLAAKEEKEVVVKLELATAARLALEVSENVDIVELSSLFAIMSNDKEGNSLITEANNAHRSTYILKIEALYRKQGIDLISTEGRKCFELDLSRTMEMGVNALRKKLELPIVPSPNSTSEGSIIKKKRSWSEISGKES